MTRFDVKDVKERSLSLSQMKKDVAACITQYVDTVNKPLGESYEGIVMSIDGTDIKVTSKLQKKAIEDKKIAVVTFGSFVGHRGHEQLVKLTIEEAKKVHGDPYVLVSPKVGKDDPIPLDVKMQTWKKLGYGCKFDTWDANGSSMKKVEKELIFRDRYKKVVILVGQDRYKKVSEWVQHLTSRLANPLYPENNDVTVEVKCTSRDTGVTFTSLREVIDDSTLDEGRQLDKWYESFNTSVLGNEWVKELYNITKQEKNKYSTIMSTV